ncbi:MAG: transcription antitermination factor NusB [Chloroflexota bacterium]
MSADVSPARRLAFATIRATFEGDAHTERAFREAAEQSGSEGRERAQAQRLAFGTVQRRGTIDAALERLADRPLRRLDPPVLAALRLGAYELLFADATPDHAAVDQAVELVKGAGAAHAAGFVNAVLRRAAREREALRETLLADDSTPEAAAVAHSAPLWLAQMWWRELGPDDARSLLAACNEPPERAFRVNTLVAQPDFMVERLLEAGISARSAASGAPYGPHGSIRRTGMETGEMIVLEGPTGDLVPELVAAGELTPQSRGSAAVVEMLDPQPGEHVLDLCAGPGIKTGQIAERMADRGEVISVESDPGRAAEVADQARRLGLRSVTVIEADATNPGMAPGFDRVLIDAPCSDLGALASRPDARWRKSPAAIDRLVEVQTELLQRGREALRPGGTLVYSTCTISRRENEEIAGEGETMQLRPDRDRTTGFFISRWRSDDAQDERDR